MKVSRPVDCIELLAPAGNFECARAAVANGADAIYFGLPRFNARMRAENFSDEELPELMGFLHGHGVRGFVAMNTLIFTAELETAERQLRMIEAAGVDAVIVQDIGLARLARAVAPRVEIHASTQMTITSPEGLEFLHERIGLDRAVLARELSIREIGKFRMDGPDRVPIEVFVHGALCVAYSGQCLTSESLGRRSANRGECAQACRMPYQLIVDGEVRDLGDRRFLVSPQDLAAGEEIPDLIRAGVRSFKIEGRLKSPEYVAAVTRVYRRLIDAACGVDADAPGEPGLERPPSGVRNDERYALEMTFSRGLSSGWLRGTNHPALVPALSGKKRGTFLGVVGRSGRDWIELESLASRVVPGDGIVIENPADTDRELGGRVFAVDGQRLVIDRRTGVDISGATDGARVFKTADPKLNDELRKTWGRAGSAAGRIPLRLRVSGKSGTPLRVEALARTATGWEQAFAGSPTTLGVSKGAGLNEHILRRHFAKLGGTPFHLAALDHDLEQGLSLPVSELNHLRREVVGALENQMEAARGRGARPVTPAKELEGMIEPIRRECALRTPANAESAGADAGAAILSVLCRSLEQVAVALECGVGLIYVDFEDIRRLRDAVAAVRESQACGAPGARVFLATPRILKAGEAGYLRLIDRAEPDGVLVRNAGVIGHFGGRPGLECVGDFSLNVANPLSAEFFIEAGLRWLTPSYDLNIAQVLDLLSVAPPPWFEITLHQHLPMFHMEHCVFCAFLSNGTDATNCGRPCETHRVELRDRVGSRHPLTADVGCRNTLFNAQAQTGARFFDQLRRAGLARFRVDLLRESAEAARQTIRAYQQLVGGSRDGADLWRELRAASRLGVTEGTLDDSR